VIVVDSSAVLVVLAAGSRSRALAARLADAGDLCAPELLDVEVLDVLHALTAAGRMAMRRATDVRNDLDALAVRRYPHEPLVNRAWELRSALTPSEGVYVALAEALGVPLVTCDHHLAATTGHQVQIERVVEAG
jgi:predicted nucleic acid-binding protein